jgi:uncharacterized metal-binding protein YceD (DUF177 family)
MSAGLPDLVDCARLAEEGAAFERVYALRELPRVQDLLADPQGSLHASFAFVKIGGGSGAKITVRAVPHLVCQRCMLGFAFPIEASSLVEFADAEPPDSEGEVYRMVDGSVSLRDLAEEELLLALPIAASCSIPESCGNAVGYPVAETGAAANEMRRPFADLQSLLKNT